MIITLVGNSSFLIRQRLNELASEFVKANGELALERIDGTDITTAGLIEAVSSQPFLANRKMVIVRDLAANKATADNIEQIISSVSSDTDLILYEPEIDRRTAYFKVLKGLTELEEFNHLEGPELARWLVDEARKQGATLALADANYLIQRAGENQMLLKNEVDKLTTYNPHINRDCINLLVEETPQSKVFELLDCAFGGQKQRTIQIYEEQRAQKVEPQQILAMIGWQVWLIALASNGGEKTTQQIAKDAGLGSSFPLDKARRLAAKISPARLRALNSQIYKIDKLSKTQPIDLDEALKTYLITI